MATKTTTRRKKKEAPPPVVHKTSDYTEIPKLTFEVKVLKKDKKDATNEEKLLALYQLQLIDSKIDEIKTIRGELPMEVADLEDEVAGLQTRISNHADEAKELQDEIASKKQVIKDATTAIKKYQAQQNNVKNNREFESLNKEIEYQQLEIQLSEKKIKQYISDNNQKVELIEAAQETLNERMGDLKTKKDELDSVIDETRKEEEHLVENSERAESMIEDYLLKAYKRIRDNALNGLAVVAVERDACGGCFNKIPPQRQLDIRQRKKIIVCEHCGRILVDPTIEELLK